MKNDTENKKDSLLQPSSSVKGMGEHTKGPWAWREFGGGTLTLVTQHSGSRVVLCAARGKGFNAQGGELQTRDANGTLRPLTEDHPNARLIAAAPEMYEALTRARDKFREYEFLHEAKSPPDKVKASINRDMANACDAALAKAKAQPQ